MRLAPVLLVTQVVAAPLRLQHVELSGTLLDEEPSLRAALELRPGLPWTETLRERTTKRLDRLGYASHFTETAMSSGTRVQIHLTPVRVIRKIYIDGTTPLLEWFDAIFESDVQRRIGFRPGQRLPEGGEQTRRFEEESRRVEEYLRRMGYFDADVEIEIEPTSRIDHVNLRYTLAKGARYQLHEVVSTGNAALSNQDIRQLVEDEYHLAFFTFPFTADRLDRAIANVLRRYHELGYPGARVRHDFNEARDLDRQRARARVDVQARERRHIDLRFLIDGTPASPDSFDALREVITLFRNSSYDEVELQESARALEHDYQRRGRFYAQTSFTRRRRTRESETVTFSIQRGPELRVRSVDFVGASSFDRAQLYDTVETRVFNFWRWVKIAAGGYATELQLKQDEKRLLDFYRQRGFADVAVRAEVSPSKADVWKDPKPGKQDLHVRFRIDEGPKVTVGQVTFNTDTRFRLLLQPMLRRLALRRGQPFDIELLRSDQARLLRALNDSGYPYAEVSTPIVERIRPDRVRIVHQVRWSRPVRFGPILVRGNFKTSERVILNEATFAPGDPFDTTQIQTTEANLRALGIFTVARVGLLGIDEQSGTAPVVIEVEERFDDYGSIEVGGGFSTDNQLFALSTYRNQNLFGLAQALEVQGEWGLQIISGRGTFTDRRLFGTRFQLDISGFLRIEETERLGDLRTVGFSVTLSRMLAERLRGFLRYEFRRVRLEKALYRPSASVEESDTEPLTPQTGALGPGFLWDWRDRPFTPTCGWSIAGTAQYASPYLLGSDSFIKVEGNAQMYLPVSGDAKAFGKGCQGRPLSGPLRGKLTVAQALRYDQGFPLGGNSFLPPMERYFGGGDTTVRGFEEDRLRASLIEISLGPGVEAFRAIPEGGNLRIIHNLELWVPLWDKSFVFGFPIVGAAFIDTGVITNSLDGFHLRDFRHGAGTAARLLFPFGFLSFEYAWPLDPSRADDPTGRFHVNFGAAFQF